MISCLLCCLQMGWNQESPETDGEDPFANPTTIPVSPPPDTTPKVYTTHIVTHPCAPNNQSNSVGRTQVYVAYLKLGFAQIFNVVFDWFKLLLLWKKRSKLPYKND